MMQCPYEENLLCWNHNNKNKKKKKKKKTRKEEEKKQKERTLEEIKATYGITYHKQPDERGEVNRSVKVPCILIKCNTQFRNFIPTALHSVTGIKYKTEIVHNKQSVHTVTYIDGNPIYDHSAKKVQIKNDVNLWDFLEDVPKKRTVLIKHKVHTHTHTYKCLHRMFVPHLLTQTFW